MPETLDLPQLRLSRQSLLLRRQCRSAGRSLIGRDQRISTGIKSWSLDLDIVLDWEPDRIRAFEAFVSRLECTTQVKIPILDAYGYDETRAPKQQPWSDGTWFSDGTGWLDPAGGAAPLVVTVAAGAGDQNLTVQVTSPNIPTLQLGDYFSHDGFLYQVTGRTGAGWVRFAPRARRAIPIGAVLDTAPAYFLALPQGEDFGRRGRGLLSHAPGITLSFVEAFDR